MAKQFFYVSVGVVGLAVAWTLLAHPVEALNPTATSSEVAILTGVLNDGDTIPLPTYSDGAVATESECHWIVSPNSQSLSVWVTPANFEFVCRTVGRVVSCYTLRYGPMQIPGQANYMVIASRAVQGDPTKTESSSWGEIKREFK